MKLNCFGSLLALCALSALSGLVAAQELCTVDENGVCVNSEGTKPKDNKVLLKFQLPAEVINTAALPKNANIEGKPREAVKDCLDRHEACKGFEHQGECTKNPGWMIINCPQSCDRHNNACALRDPNLRCTREALNISTEPIYKPGDMNNMFSTIQSRFGDRYEVNILSESPWVVTLDNFLSDKEVDAIISTQERWERSTDTGSMNEYGESGRVLSTGRTSSNSWCRAECENHPDVRSAIRKIEEVTRVPYENYESFQVLKYELNQHYGVHHDCSADDNRLTCGPRILTFFLYLSDVEEGGETAFPRLDLKVKPKKGRGLLWPSTLNANPAVQDPRTMHAAMPVVRGTKFAANSWIHLYNYAKSNLWGCTGAFDEL